MSLIKKFKVGDRIEVLSGDAKGCVGKIDQVDLMKKHKVPFWWYGVVLDNPPAGVKRGGLFRDYAIKKI